MTTDVSDWTALWQHDHDKLYEKLRRKADIKPMPSAGMIDSQAFKTQALHKGAAQLRRGKKITG